MMKKLNVTREELKKMFLKTLDEAATCKQWEQPYILPHIHNCYNPITKTHYKGINKFLLTLKSMERNYNDPRFCTAKQAIEKGWKLKYAKGMGLPCEYAIPFHKKNKVSIRWHEYDQLSNEDKEDYYIHLKTYFVFNFEHLEGPPPLELEKSPTQVITQDKTVKQLAESMGVPIRVNSLYTVPSYSVEYDKISSPPKEWYKTDYDYNATILHELSHATGHSSRLDRKSLYTYHESKENRAYEELVAEMAAAYMSNDLALASSPSHIENHIAYISSWKRLIEKNPNTLFTAIGLSEKAVSYMETLLKQKSLEQHYAEVAAILDVEEQETGKLQNSEIVKNKNLELEIEDELEF